MEIILVTQINGSFAYARHHSMYSYHDCCLRHYQEMSWLKTTTVYYFTVSAGNEFEHGLTG